MWKQYATLMRLEKPIGSFLLLWPTLIALWVAQKGHPDPYIVGVFMLGVLVMRSAGCVINDFADRFVDGEVERTKNRPLAKGTIKSSHALGIFFLLCCSAFLLVLQLNRYTQLLSMVGLALAVLYPFMKRYTHLPQFVLGLAFAWAIPMAFAASLNKLPLASWILFGITFFWTVAFDTEYAMVDKKDDVRVGIKSTAIAFGSFDRFYIAFFHCVMFILLMQLGLALQFSFIYYVGICLAGLNLCYQHYLIRDRVPAECFKAFLSNNYFGAIVFSTVVLEYLF